MSRPTFFRRIRHCIERLYERIHARPLSLLVFGASVALLIYLQGGTIGRFEARAVAHARVVEHPARVTSFVEKLYVQPGQHVDGRGGDRAREARSRVVQGQ